MKKITIPTNVSRNLHKVGFAIKKASPEILVAVGIIGVGASMVMACKATTKAGAIMEETKAGLDAIHECADNLELAEKYTEEDKKKDTAIVYLQTGVKYAKLYGPSVLLCVASLGCILKSHDIMRKRNMALAAAYAAVDKGFKEYRGRVIERLGAEMDKELRYNIKAQEIEEEVVDEKTGKTKKVKKTISVMDPNAYSPYAIVFDDGNIGWDKDPELTKFFLVQQQNYANDMLKSRGYLFLNDVYEMLGAPRTKAGQVVGWIYDEKCPVGDNFVDFGIFNIDDPKACDFVNGRERVIVLDFNVDGNIWEMM